MTELQEVKLNRMFINLFSDLHDSVGITGMFYILPSYPYKYCIFVPYEVRESKIVLNDILKHIEITYDVEKTIVLEQKLLKAILLHFNIKQYVIQD